MRLNWDKNLHRQMILNRLSSKELEEYEQNWETINRIEVRATPNPALIW